MKNTASQKTTSYETYRITKIQSAAEPVWRTQRHKVQPDAEKTKPRTKTRHNVVTNNTKQRKLISNKDALPMATHPWNHTPLGLPFLWATGLRHGLRLVGGLVGWWCSLLGVFQWLGGFIAWWAAWLVLWLRLAGPSTQFLAGNLSAPGKILLVDLWKSCMKLPRPGLMILPLWWFASFLLSMFFIREVFLPISVIGIWPDSDNRFNAPFIL